VCRRIAGSVADEDSVEFWQIPIERVSIEREAENSNSAVQKLSENSVFRSAVEEDDGFSGGIFWFEDFRGFWRNFGNKSSGTKKFRLGIVEIFVVGISDFCEHRAAFAEDLSEVASVDSGEDGNFLLTAPVGEFFSRKFVARMVARLGEDDSAGVDAGGFENFVDFLGGFRVGNAVISDERVGENDDLSEITWVGASFEVASHAGGEDDFSGGGSVGADGFSGEFLSGFEN